MSRHAIERKPLQAFFKRLLDVVGAATLLALAGPVLAAVAVAIRLRMGRPVLFTQQRPGRQERPFTLCKFRTMGATRGPGGRLLGDAERLTPFGRSLRRWSVDELPQLWNVVRGDMSLVGPRPLLVRYLPFYTDRERLRHAMRPGITGWAQLHGRNEVPWDRRLALDVWYVEHWNLWLDLWILLRTVGATVSRRGVVDDPRSAMLNLDEERQGLLPGGHGERASRRCRP
jgi:lipopolysaccharide/colanic/teichoic acid biosynthesis glycosyltransferase